MSKVSPPCYGDGGSSCRERAKKKTAGVGSLSFELVSSLVLWFVHTGQRALSLRISFTVGGSIAPFECDCSVGPEYRGDLQGPHTQS